jgi:hypothetical protein
VSTINNVADFVQIEAHKAEEVYKERTIELPGLYVV